LIDLVEGKDDRGVSNGEDVFLFAVSFKQDCLTFVEPKRNVVREHSLLGDALYGLPDELSVVYKAVRDLLVFI
jgi:hypothetical protein